jgi:soluble lytic murein transglycosylase-like protein
MKHRPSRSVHSRRSFTVLSTLLFLAFTFRPAPSDPAVTDLRHAESDREAVLQDLADWAAGPRALHPEDLAAATESAAPRRFELFPRSISAEQQRRFLRDLPYGRAMAMAAERHRVDGLLVAAIVEAESGFVPDRISPRGAVGLMQVLPSTAGALKGSGGVGETPDLFDPRVNLDVGSRYLGRLIRDYKGDLELAVAAYNAGPGAVERYRGVPPYRETKEYVRRVLALYGEHHQSVGSERDPFSPPVGGLAR